jgi:hypothetical protein
MNSSFDSVHSFCEDGYYEALKCPVCNEIFKYPRILPCGDSVCFVCIILLREKDDLDGSDKFKCPVCEQIHLNLTSDLPRNNAIENMIKLNLTTLYPNKHTQELMFNLKILRKLANRFKDLLSDPLKDVENSCEALRKQVIWATKRKAEILNGCKNMLLEQIEVFEVKCLQKMSSLGRSSEFRETIASSERLIQSVDDFTLQQADYLSKSLLNENEIEEANEKTKGLFMDLCWDMKTVDLLRYEQGKMEFISNEDEIDSKILGRLEQKLEGIKTSRDSFDVLNEGFMQNSLREIDAFMMTNETKRF